MKSIYSIVSTPTHPWPSPGPRRTRRSSNTLLATALLHAAACTCAQEPAPAASEHATGFRFEGTDLHLGEAPPISFHGFLSQGYLHSSDYNYLGSTRDGSFAFTELGLNASMQPFPRTRIALQGFAFDLGDVGNFDPFLDYASIEYTFQDWLGVRGGRVRRPAGIYNHIQDVDLARTSVLLPQGMYDARWRDFSTSVDGGLVFGSFSLGKAGSLSYEAYSGMGSIGTDGGVAQWITDGNAGTVTGFDQPLYLGGQLWWHTPLEGLRLGVSLAQMFDFGFDLSVPVSQEGPFGPIEARNTNNADVFLHQYSIEYLWRAWTFQAEYSTYRFDGITTTKVLSGTVPIAPETRNPSVVTPDSWYVSAAYRFNPWFEASTYYSEYYADRSDRSQGGSPDASQKDLAVSLRFDPTDWWILKLEGHYLRGTALLQDQDRNPLAERNDDGWFMLALKTTFSF